MGLFHHHSRKTSNNSTISNRIFLEVTVFYWIVMNVIKMHFKIIVIPDRVFPKSILPYILNDGFESALGWRELLFS